LLEAKLNLLGRLIVYVKGLGIKDELMQLKEGGIQTAKDLKKLEVLAVDF
jgi:hypothetical protein